MSQNRELLEILLKVSNLEIDVVRAEARIQKIIRGMIREAKPTMTDDQVQRIIQAGVDNVEFKGSGKKKAKIQ